MLTEQPILITSIKAPAAITKNLFVGFDGNLCSANAKALGVSNADTDEAEQLPVTSNGIALVYSGNAITLGDKIASDANGKAVTYSTGEFNGWALDAALSADVLIRVLLT